MTNRRSILAGLALLCAWSAAAPAADLPRKAPPLAISLTNGEQVLLASCKGKVVAMCFILTGCSHCQLTTGLLVKDQAEYGPRGFQALAAAINQDAAAAVPGFIKSFHTNFPVGIIDPMKAIDFMHHPPALVPHMPLLAFIDRQGNIRAQYEGDNEKFFGAGQEQNLRAQIEALLEESPAVGKGPAKKATPKKGS